MGTAPRWHTPLVRALHEYMSVPRKGALPDAAQPPVASLTLQLPLLSALLLLSLWPCPQRTARWCL